MTRPAHAPYASGGDPFSIGLKPLDTGSWIEPDGQLAFYLSEKRRLLDAARDEVWAAEAETRESQMEVRDALVAHLLAHSSGRWTKDGDAIRVFEGGAAIASVETGLEDPEPLLSAALLVQEDLCLMRRGDDGWRLAAGSVCFASSWSFREKFGQTLDGLHAPVPGYRERLAVRMARIFDNLHVGRPVWRLNWSLYGDDALHHPHAQEPIRFPVGNDAGDRGWLERVFVRVERQTLTRMPGSGDIVFTIRIHLDPLSALAGHPERPVLAEGLLRQLDALDTDQLVYKGLAAHRDRLGEVLGRLARG